MIRNTRTHRAIKALFTTLTMLSGGSLFQYGCGGGAGLYDPYWDIQSSIGYRQDVMDWSNYAWGSYMRDEDYLGYDAWYDAGSPISNDVW